MYAIFNKRTKKFVYGTDKRHRPHTQRTSKNKMLTFEYIDECEHEMIMRECGKDYMVVELEVKVKDKIENTETLWNYKKPYEVGDYKKYILRSDEE